MKILAAVILGSLMFMSCGKVEEPGKPYRVAADGLLYYRDSERLYTGTITDSTTMIMSFDVIDGKKNGVFLVYYRDGNLAQTGYIIDNKNEGEWRYYYRNGSIESKGDFLNDLPDGKWSFYYPDGSLKSGGEFRQGQRHGRWFFRNSSSSDINYIFYKNGKFLDMEIKKG